MKRERSVLPGMIGPYRPEKKLGSGQVRKRRKKGWLEEGRGWGGKGGTKDTIEINVPVYQPICNLPAATHTKAATSDLVGFLRLHAPSCAHGRRSYFSLFSSFPSNLPSAKLDTVCTGLARWSLRKRPILSNIVLT